MKIKEPLSRIIDMLSNLISKFNIPVTIAVIMLFIITVNAHSQSGWFSQPLPVNGQVQDLKFFDANTGLILMNEPFRIYRTTNGGYHWDSTIHNQYITLIDVIDSTSVYGVGAFANGSKQIIRSYDRGFTWDSMAVTVLETINGISFVNRDTGWVGGTAGALPFLWRTTNAGVTWTVQSTNTGFGIIFFLKQKVKGEYIGWSMNYSDLWKTTNSGVNWTHIQSSFSTATIYFINKDTGFASVGSNMKKTTNGGINWVNQPLPSDSTIFTRRISEFAIQGETIYGTGGSRYLGGTATYSIILKTTNFGETWGYQQPDTSIDRFFDGIDFVNKDSGWSSGIRTNNGGGPIIMPTYIPNNGENAAGYELMQNYPNPFNSSTAIELSVPKDSYVSLKITDLTGKTVFRVLYEMPLRAGTHKFTINGFGKLNLASGVYFYTIDSRDMYSNKSKFTKTRKMLFIK